MAMNCIARRKLCKDKNNFIMQSHRAIFSLKGTNITLPTRYKVRRFKGSKIQSEKPEGADEVIDEQLPFIIESKQPPHISMKINLNSNQLHVSQQTYLPRENMKQYTVNLITRDAESTSTSNPKLSRETENAVVFRKGREHYSSMKYKRCTCGDCEECMKDFAYFLHLFSDDQSVPEISAKSWCIWKRKNGRFMYYYGKRIHKVREIASLTKMVTAMTAVDFLNKYGWEPQEICYEVKKTSTLVGGTTANLIEGQVYNLLELFYGMMLPSGNDAAIAISEVIGLLCFLKSRNRSVNPRTQDWYKPYSTKNYSYLFIGMMNQKCQRIGTIDTKLFNSHGNDAYEQLKNVSTCNELAKLSSEFVTYPLLQNIVKTSHYGPYENTNKLLEDGFDGIKTGITDSAGPCLAASYKDYIIVVLNSKSMNERWIEVKKLVKWIIKKS